MVNYEETDRLSSFSPDQQKAIQAEIMRLKDADDEALDKLNDDSTIRRLKWYRENRAALGCIGNDLLMSAYLLLVHRFGVTTEEMPIDTRSESTITFHSVNFCPTLEACKLLGLDTRHICRRINERSTDLLIKQLDPRLAFSRNYEKLRPYTPYCEEMISLKLAD